MADAGVDGLALLGRQLQAREPLTAFDAEQVRARRLALQPALQHGVDLVLGARPGAHELLAAREPAAQDPAALIWHPHRLKLTLPQQARQRPRVELVGLRSRVGDPGVVRADHDHPVHMRLEDPGDLPTAARHLQRHPVGRQQALSQRPRSLRRARHPTRPSEPPRPRRSRPRRSRGGHPSRSRDRPISTTAPLTSINTVDSAAGEPAGQRHRPIRARSSIQASRRGGRTKSPGSKPIDQNGLPVCVLPKKPLSRIGRT